MSTNVPPSNGPEKPPSIVDKSPLAQFIKSGLSDVNWTTYRTSVDRFLHGSINEQELGSTIGPILSMNIHRHAHNSLMRSFTGHFTLGPRLPGQLGSINYSQIPEVSTVQDHPHDHSPAPPLSNEDTSGFYLLSEYVNSEAIAEDYGDVHWGVEEQEHGRLEFGEPQTHLTEDQPTVSPYQNVASDTLPPALVNDLAPIVQDAIPVDPNLVSAIPQIADPASSIQPPAPIDDSASIVQNAIPVDPDLFAAIPQIADPESSIQPPVVINDPAPVVQNAAPVDPTVIPQVADPASDIPPPALINDPAPVVQNAAAVDPTAIPQTANPSSAQAAVNNQNHSATTQQPPTINSDADTNHHCTHARRFDPDQAKMNRFVENLRTQWLQQGGSQNVRIHIPNGYILVGIRRADNSTKDYFVYGHPSHYRFRSGPDFFVHLCYLIARTNRPNETHTCQCKGCR